MKMSQLKQKEYKIVVGVQKSQLMHNTLITCQQIMKNV